MNHILKSALLKSSIAIACLSASSVYAQEIEEIIVTAKGNQTIDESLFTTHLFTEADIEAAQVKDIPALLQRISGISITESGGRGSATSVFIRGASNSQIIVLIDGVRVGSATLGAAALNSYPIEAIERIEVIKGPFSGIYGADAAGGVIQLFTKKSHEGIGTVSVSFGSNDLDEQSISFGAGNERNSFHIAAQRERTNGIDRTSITTDGNDDIDAFEEEAISFGGKLSFSDHVTASLNILATKNTVQFDNTFGVDSGFETDNETFSSALNITAQLSPSLKWTTTFGYNEDESVTDAFFSDITTDREAFGTELEFAASKNVYLTFGLDYFDESIDTLTAFPETERDNKAAYFQVATQDLPVNFTGSLRYDDNSAYGSETNGSAALSVNLNKNIRLVGSYGTSFIAPSFNQLFFPFFGNPDILPEESESYELSLLGNVGITNWRISAYRTDVDNLIGFDLTTFLAGNTNEATLEGLELELNSQLSGWDIAINIDLLSATDETSNTELNDRAERSLSVSANRDFGKLNIGLDFRGESRRFDGDTQLGGYGLFDISAVYKVSDSFSISGNLDNIFDKDYTVNLVNATERFNTEGRQAKVTFKYAF